MSCAAGRNADTRSSCPLLPPTAIAAADVQQHSVPSIKKDKLIVCPSHGDDFNFLVQDYVIDELNRVDFLVHKLHGLKLGALTRSPYPIAEWIIIDNQSQLAHHFLIVGRNSPERTTVEWGMLQPRPSERYASQGSLWICPVDSDGSILMPKQYSKDISQTLPTSLSQHIEAISWSPSRASAYLTMIKPMHKNQSLALVLDAHQFFYRKLDESNSEVVEIRSDLSQTLSGIPEAMFADVFLLRGLEELIFGTGESPSLDDAAMEMIWNEVQYLYSMAKCCQDLGRRIYAAHRLGRKIQVRPLRPSQYPGLDCFGTSVFLTRVLREVLEIQANRLEEQYHNDTAE